MPKPGVCALSHGGRRELWLHESLEAAALRHVPIESQQPASGSRAEGQEARPWTNWFWRERARHKIVGSPLAGDFTTSESAASGLPTKTEYFRMPIVSDLS